MKVLVLSNGELQKREIENTLEELQKIVGGNIEFPFLGKVFAENEIDIIINEDGKYIDGLKPEIAVMTESGNIYDIIYGNCIFASHDNVGNTVELTDKQIEVVTEKLKAVAELIHKDTGERMTVKALFV